MNSRVAFPFLVLSDDAVQFEAWMIGDPGQPLIEAEDLLEGWDYARDLEINPVVTINWTAVAEELQLPLVDLRLRLSLIVGTGVGNLPRRQDRMREMVVDSTSTEIAMSALIAGKMLSGRIRLAFQVTLESPVSAGSVLSPTVRGARLWQTHHDLLIEDGGDSRFPIETVSFGHSFAGQPQEHAPWYLHWKPNMLMADFAGSVRLYVNSDQEEIARRVVDGDGPTLQAILADVMSQMVASILEHEEAAEAIADCGEGSVGQQIRGWLETAFPGHDLSTVRSMNQHTPGRFRAAILAVANMDHAE